MTVNSTDAKHTGGNAAKPTRPLSTKATELLNDRTHGNFPVWVRPPRTGNLEFYSQVSRAKLYELAAAGKIVSRSIREPGQTRGTRLFLLSSILDFIAGCDEGKPQSVTAGKGQS